MTRYRNLALVFLALLAVVLFTTFVVSGKAFAATTVTLAWDANTEPDLAGYKLYQSSAEPGPFLPVQTLGTVTTTTVVVPDGAYWWALTAFDTVGNESGFSNVVTFQADTTPPQAPSALRVTSAVVNP